MGIWLRLFWYSVLIFPNQIPFEAKAYDAPRNEEAMHINIIIYASRMIELNEYFSVFMGSDMSDKYVRVKSMKLSFIK